MPVWFRFKRLAYVFVFIACAYGCVHLLRSQLGAGAYDEDREVVLKDIYQLVAASRGRGASNGLAHGQACRHPRLDLHDPDIMRHISRSPPIDCGETRDWVEISGSTARITDEARAEHGDIECWFTDIIRESDHSTHDGVTTQTHTEYHLEESDFVKVHCKSQGGDAWHSIMAGVRHDQDVLDRTGWDRLPADALRLNVLMFGYDSLSRNMFIRKLPKTYDYLHSALGGVTLEGYNIVGDGTPQALIPILTGRTELELPETRKRMGDRASYVDVYPFVWKEFRDSGYVTAYSEDCANTGTFTYRLKGFNAPPTDHYMRPYYLVAPREFSSHRKYCMGSIPRHKLMMNYASDMFRVYKDEPKFMFGFHGELSHDAVNLIGAADDDMVGWLRGLEADGHLNNTLLVVMSDHGSRFTNIRNTLQGKQEERLPFFTFVFPPWFERAHPTAMANFRTNAHRLTTPFDVHATLVAVLRYPGSARGSVADRGIALFGEVPPERTCADAFIEPHWCACLDWEEVSLADPLVARAGTALVEHINRYTHAHRDICAELRVVHVQWAAQLLPSQGLLRYRKNKDSDGFVGDMSDRTAVSHKVFQVKVATEPGGGLFEASLTYSVRPDTFTVQTSDISRINRYGSAAHCVYEKLEQLRKYCYCKAKQPEQ